MSLLDPLDELREENARLRALLDDKASDLVVITRQLAAAEPIVTRVRIMCQDEGGHMHPVTKMRFAELLERYDRALEP